MKTINNVQEDYVGFYNALLLNELGFNISCMRFYTKLRSKMFGIDEHNRYYPIKNTSYKLYTLGEHAALKEKNVIPAPTIQLAVKWIYENFGIWIEVRYIIKNGLRCFSSYIDNSLVNKDIFFNDYDTPKEAYQEAMLQFRTLARQIFLGTIAYNGLAKLRCH